MDKLNLAGKKYGKLSVIKTYTFNARSYCDCDCDCGNKLKVLSHSIKSGNTRSCGCLSKVDITGKEYGRLTVVKRHHKSYWLCKCSCGKFAIVLGSCLKSKNTRSCGCLHSNPIKEKHWAKGDLSILLKDIPETYYWIGYLMADGCIDFKTQRLSFSQSNEDKNSVLLFKKYIHCLNRTLSINYKTTFGNSSKRTIQIQDKKFIPEIAKKFGFKRNKTYNACSLYWIKSISMDLYSSFLIGFIDGDGCIGNQTGRKDCFIRIKLHKSWLYNLQIMMGKLFNLIDLKVPKAAINKLGYAEVQISNSIACKFLKRKASELKLPYLKRKWNLIDLNFIGRVERAQQRREKIKELILKGWRKTDIAAFLEVFPSAVTSAIKRHNLPSYKGKNTGELICPRKE